MQKVEWQLHFSACETYFTQNFEVQGNTIAFRLQNYATLWWLDLFFNGANIQIMQLPNSYGLTRAEVQPQAELWMPTMLRNLEEIFCTVRFEISGK